MEFHDYTIVGIVIATSLALLSAEWAFASWINKQFSSLKSFVYTEIKFLRDEIMNKLEYHERHDDKRFSQVHNDIWELRLQDVKGHLKGRQEEFIKDKND